MYRPSLAAQSNPDTTLPICQMKMSSKTSGRLLDVFPGFLGLLGAVGFDPGDGPLQPVLHVLAQLLFRLAGRGDRNAVAI
jgi:hypothetical protein